MKYARLKEDCFGFKKDDICKIIETKDFGDYFHVQVPGRISTSELTPNVSISKHNLIRSTEKEYNDAHGIIKNEIKPEDLIKGEYYVATSIDGDYTWIEKHKNVRDNKIYSNECIDIIHDNYINNGFSYGNEYTWRKATQSEINWLNACIKINDFVSEPKSNLKKILAKKGDYVILLSSCTGNDNWNRTGSGIPVDHVYKLSTDCFINDFHIVKDRGGSTNNGWSCSSLSTDGSNSKLAIRLATKNEIEYYLKYDKPFNVVSSEYTDWLVENKNKKLESFFIKYNDSFTEKVFNQLVSKIVKMGYPLIGHINLTDRLSDIKLKYDSFKEYGFLRTQVFKDIKPEFCVDNNDQNIKTEFFLNSFGLSYESKVNTTLTPITVPLIADPWLDIPQSKSINKHLKPSVVKRKKRVKQLITVKQLKL